MFDPPSSTSRRTALQRLAALGLASVLSKLGYGKDEAPLVVPKTTLGKRKIPVSRLCLGGWHIGCVVTEKDARTLLERAFTLGVNFFDSAYTYGDDGESERRIGAAFKGKRPEVVLMSKSTQRNAADSERELDESLKRLGTDYLDIWQFHSIRSVAEAEKIAGKGGTVETARKALADGRVKVLGATGHNSPEGLARLLQLVPEIEATQFVINCVDPHWNSFLNTTMPVAKKRGLTVLAMKTLALGTLAKTKTVTVEEAIRYALSQGPDVWVSGITSIEELETNLRLLQNFKPMSADEQTALLKKSMPLKGAGTESYKTWPT